MSARVSTAVMERLSLLLATSRGGRIALHLACIVAGSDRGMHWDGISRELCGQ
jgi:hypothetical protein